MRAGRWRYTLPLRLRSLLRGGAVECDLDDEVRVQLEKQIEQYIARGMAPDEARRAARRQFGGVEQKKEECREMGHVRLVDELIRDVRYAVRTLVKAPAFTAAVVTTIALAVGATTATLTVVSGVVLRPLRRLSGTRPDSGAREPDRDAAGVVRGCKF
jgi:hypothetical protein